MGTINYEELIEKRPKGGDQIEQLKRANKLAEIARNLETMHELAEEADKRSAPETTPAVPVPEQAEE